MTTHLAIVPRSPVSIRVATMADLPFIDGLQKMHSKQLGYFPTKQFEGYIEGGHVLMAEDASGARLGYCISKDRYLKRDELGVIYQLCVSPGSQRGLIGASLIREVFARSAYGCRLYCCWCAQDLEANRFWEALGFLPIAFRAGSSGKKRVHIFWQRRICEGDESTPYWYPFQTSSGAIREDRLVFPIPPGVHWRDVRAVEVPVEENHSEARQIERKPSPAAPPAGVGTKGPAKKPAKLFAPRGLSFAPPPAPVAPVQAMAPDAAKLEARPRKRAKTPPKKIDPTYLAGARELRDRWLERVNADPSLLLAQGKYDVVRTLPAPPVARRKALSRAA